MNQPRNRSDIAPLARKDGLLVKELPGEVLLYDLGRDKAFCLNATAASVWKNCDGSATPAQMAESLQLPENVVWYAIDQLGKDRLLEQRVRIPQHFAGLTRRQLAKAAAIAVPIVTAVVAPHAADASTCLPPGAGCTSGAQCCSTVCTGGTTCA